MMISSPPSPNPTYRPVLVLKLAGGFTLLLVGGLLALPGVPGPGIPIVLLGLLLLSGHFTWARIALAWVRERAENFRTARPKDNETDGDGQPRAVAAVKGKGWRP